MKRVGDDDAVGERDRGTQGAADFGHEVWSVQRSGAVELCEFFERALVSRAGEPQRHRVGGHGRGRAGPGAAGP